MLLPQDFCVKTMQAVTRQPIKSFFFDFPRGSPSDQPLAKEPEDSGYEIGKTRKNTIERINNKMNKNK